MPHSTELDVESGHADQLMVLTTKGVSYCDGVNGAVSVSVVADPQAVKTSANDAANTRGDQVGNVRTFECHC